MKRSAPKQSLSDILKNDTRPRSPKIERDESDDLAKMFDDGTPLRASDPPQPIPSPTIPLQPQPIAPARDFNKRANSIERDALPAGLFPGSSKKLYDALYLRTRGANPPRASVKATKRDLMDWSGIRNVKTVETHMRYLVGVGLIVKTGENGDREGFAYEVRYPEQATHPNQPPPSPSIPDGDRKTVVVGEQKTVVVGEGQLLDSQRPTGEPKTELRLKEQNTDDEASRLASALSQAERELTGKNAAKGEQWDELASVLITELRIAAGRTTVSSVPAFLAEHLRRRLWKLDKARLDASGGAVEARERASGGGAEHKVDASQCPDCYGTGLRYHGGDYANGVERCPHDKLSPDPDS